MTEKTEFKPIHINACKEDLLGNHGLGRYILIPGSDGRAKDMADNFDNLIVKSHPRGHNLYMGTITHDGTTVDVASISSGMGCPSFAIIMTELHRLGAKRFLRVGTCGALQEFIKPGSVLVVRATVRDEDTSKTYMPIEVPVLASHQMLQAINEAVDEMGMTEEDVNFGTVHCKSAFHSRQFFEGPLAKEHEAYIQVLRDCGVHASEMETSALFTLGQLFNYQSFKENQSQTGRVKVGAILGVVSDGLKFAGEEIAKNAENAAVSLALRSLICLARQEYEVIGVEKLVEISG